MFKDAPGAAFRNEVVTVSTTQTAVGMPAALERMAHLAFKLARGEALDRPDVDGYLPRGIRKNELAPTRAADRAVSLVLQKMAGTAFATEWPVPAYRPVAPRAPLAETAKAPLVAFVTEGGVVPAGNPDRLPGAWATRWAEYDISNLTDLAPRSFESVHGGFDTSHANEDPDRIVPLDVLRDLEDAGALRLDNRLYSTVGNMGSIEMMERLGADIARALHQSGVDAVIVGST
jgi:glycine reductase